MHKNQVWNKHFTGTWNCPVVNHTCSVTGLLVSACCGIGHRLVCIIACLHGCTWWGHATSGLGYHAHHILCRRRKAAATTHSWSRGTTTAWPIGSCCDCCWAAAGPLADRRRRGSIAVWLGWWVTSTVPATVIMNDHGRRLTRWISWHGFLIWIYHRCQSHNKILTSMHNASQNTLMHTTWLLFHSYS